MSLKIVEISDEYINYMKQFFMATMMDNKVESRKYSRKYVGVVLEVNDLKYFVPMSSPKVSDYNLDGTIRASSTIILRMVKKSKHPLLLGTLKLNNMIPVPESEIIEYDLNNEPDAIYKNLVADELIWIQRNTMRIINAANLIYQIKLHESNNINERNKKFYKSIMPFKDAEEKSLKYDCR